MEKQIISMIPAEPNLFQVHLYDRGEDWDEPNTLTLFSGGKKTTHTYTDRSRYYLSAHRIVGWAHVRDYSEHNFDTDIKPLLYEDCDDIGVTIHSTLGVGNTKFYNTLFINIPVMYIGADVPVDMEDILREPLVIRSFLEDAYKEQHQNAHENCDYSHDLSTGGRD